jgi:glutamyl-tRNA synthetase
MPNPTDSAAPHSTAHPGPVRTRIAPSPTGDPHVGTAYMALFNWAFAKHHGGQFIVRIEDTDAARSSTESEAKVFSALRWLGLSWDEGPEVGGPAGPYRQSERLPIYREHVDQLLAADQAFPCFCTSQRLDEMRSQQREKGETSGYDGACLGLAATEAQRRIAAGESHVIRMRVPTLGDCEFRDELRGEISIPFTQIDMQVLLKADGFPTYHLAVVVDDHLMGITHVIRGEEWINSVPKHKLLYDYFGWPMPTLVHMPLLRNPDSSKLSKRKNPTSVTYYERAGYLPEALLNYLGTMGWSMPDEREIFSVQEMSEQFDLSRVTLGGPIFDQTKLGWLNGQYLRNLSPEQFMQRVAAWAVNSDHLAPLVPLLQQRTERLADLAPQVDYLLGDRVALNPESFAHKKLSVGQCLTALHHYSSALDELRTWDREVLVELAQGLAEHLQLKLSEFLFPVFIAVAGRGVALPVFDSMVFLGSDLTRVRLRDGLQLLGLSKKQTKKLDKAYVAWRDSR